MTEMRVRELIETAIGDVAEETGMVFVRSEEIGQNAGGYLLINRTHGYTFAVLVRGHQHKASPPATTPGEAYAQMLKEKKGDG